MSTDEERIEIDSEDSLHYENIPVQIVQDEDIARRREEESISPFEINEFKKWLRRENFMKGKTILRYVAALKVIAKDEQAQQEPKDYLEEVKKNQSRTTFQQKYWVMEY